MVEFQSPVILMLRLLLPDNTDTQFVGVVSRKNGMSRNEHMCRESTKRRQKKN